MENYSTNHQIAEDSNISANHLVQLRKYALVVCITSVIFGTIVEMIPDDEACFDLCGLACMLFLCWVVSTIVYFISGSYIDNFDAKHTTTTLCKAFASHQNGELSIEQYNQIKFSSIIQTRKMPPRSILITAIVGITLSVVFLLFSLTSDDEYSNTMYWILDFLSIITTLGLMVGLYKFVNQRIDSTKREELLNKLLYLHQQNAITDQEFHKLGSLL